MKRIMVMALVHAWAITMLIGCSAGGDGVTVTGTVKGSYFGIVDDVVITVTRDTSSSSVAVGVAGDPHQIGSFLFTNIPAGEYEVEISFEAQSINTDFPNGTTTSVNGGAYVPADCDVVTGAAEPYLHVITIGSLAINGDETIDVDFGDVE